MHSEEAKKNRLKQFYPALTYLKKQTKRMHTVEQVKIGYRSVRKMQNKFKEL